MKIRIYWQNISVTCLEGSKIFHRKKLDYVENMKKQPQQLKLHRKIMFRNGTFVNNVDNVINMFSSEQLFVFICQWISLKISSPHFSSWLKFWKKWHSKMLIEVHVYVCLRCFSNRFIHMDPLIFFLENNRL